MSPPACTPPEKPWWLPVLTAPPPPAARDPGVRPGGGWRWVLRWEGRMRGRSELGPQGSGGRDEKKKKGEETIWFPCRWVKCGAGGREREGGGREGEGSR